MCFFFVFFFYEKKFANLFSNWGLSKQRTFHDAIYEEEYGSDNEDECCRCRGLSAILCWFLSVIILVGLAATVVLTVFFILRSKFPFLLLFIIHYYQIIIQFHQFPFFYYCHLQHKNLKGYSIKNQLEILC